METTCSHAKRWKLRQPCVISGHANVAPHALPLSNAYWAHYALPEPGTGKTIQPLSLYE